MKIKLNELKSLGEKALTKYGYNEDELKIILDVLLYSQLRGGNQGLVKLIGRGLPKSPDAGEIKIERETKLSAILNGNKNNGMVVLSKALNMALDKAKEHGFGIVGTNNTNTSTGAIGYFANKIAKEGFVAFIYAGSPETVSAFGSYEPIFGTNPLAIGIPTETDPLVLDMATSIMAYYGLIEASLAGKSIPEGIAYDSEGNETTDPNKAMDGALKPFDKNHKGYGLSMMVEILTGPLVGASFTGIGNTESNWGNLIYVIDPELLTDKTEFKKNVSKLIEKVKKTKTLPGVNEILVPGERGNKVMKIANESQEIEIEDNLYNELLKVVKD